MHFESNSPLLLSHSSTGATATTSSVEEAAAAATATRNWNNSKRQDSVLPAAVFHPAYAGKQQQQQQVIFDPEPTNEELLRLPAHELLLGGMMTPPSQHQHQPPHQPFHHLPSGASTVFDALGTSRGSSSSATSAVGAADSASASGIIVQVQHNYHDRANEDETSLRTNHHHPSTNHHHALDYRFPCPASAPFPLKLHEFLWRAERDGVGHVVSWQPHGRCFCIHKPNEFKAQVLERYMNLTKMTSFTRQLNLYGFQRITVGKDRGGYYHEYFLRGKVSLSRFIVRKKVKGTGVRPKSNPDTEPDFWGMSWVGVNATPGVTTSTAAAPAAASSILSSATTTTSSSSTSRTTRPQHHETSSSTTASLSASLREAILQQQQHDSSTKPAAMPSSSVATSVQHIQQSPTATATSTILQHQQHPYRPGGNLSQLQHAQVASDAKSHPQDQSPSSLTGLSAMISGIKAQQAYASSSSTHGSQPVDNNSTATFPPNNNTDNTTNTTILPSLHQLQQSFVAKVGSSSSSADAGETSMARVWNNALLQQLSKLQFLPSSVTPLPGPSSTTEAGSFQDTASCKSNAVGDSTEMSRNPPNVNDQNKNPSSQRCTPPQFQQLQPPQIHVKAQPEQDSTDKAPIAFSSGALDEGNDIYSEFGMPFFAFDGDLLLPESTHNTNGPTGDERAKSLPDMPNTLSILDLRQLQESHNQLATSSSSQSQEYPAAMGTPLRSPSMSSILASIHDLYSGKKTGNGALPSTGSSIASGMFNFGKSAETDSSNSNNIQGKPNSNLACNSAPPPPNIPNPPGGSDKDIPAAMRNMILLGGLPAPPALSSFPTSLSSSATSSVAQSSSSRQETAAMDPQVQGNATGTSGGAAVFGNDLGMPTSQAENPAGIVSPSGAAGQAQKQHQDSSGQGQHNRSSSVQSMMDLVLQTDHV